MSLRFSLLSRICLAAAVLVVVAIPVRGHSCLRGFDGEWKTNYGTMPIRSSGSQASASYGSGRTLTGTIQGSAFAGTWKHPSGRWG